MSHMSPSEIVAAVIQWTEKEMKDADATVSMYRQEGDTFKESDAIGRRAALMDLHELISDILMNNAKGGKC